MNHRTAAFLEHRRLLFTLAYCMLADVASAELLLEEVYLELLTGQLSLILDSRIDFVREIVKRCIDGRSTTRTVCFTSFHSESYFSLSPGIMSQLAKLNPLDRALFILREVFAYDYQEISNMLDQSEDDCRERYRQVIDRLGGEAGIYRAEVRVHERLIHQFMRGILERDATILAGCLSEDVLLLTDGAGSSMVVRAQGLAVMPDPIRGRTEVTQIMIQVLDRLLAGGRHFHWEIAITNGLPSIISYVGKDAVCLQSFESDGDRIRNIYVQVTTDKLVGLRKP